MKYGEKINNVDYYFIPQDNDTYIFAISPKYTGTKLFMKVVSYEEARDFIQSIHIYKNKQASMTKWYLPSVGIVEQTPSVKMQNKKLSWEEFEKKYIKTAHCSQEIQGIGDRILGMTCGSNIPKGSYDKKMNMIIERYNNMTDTQYLSLIEKMEK